MSTPDPTRTDGADGAGLQARFRDVVAGAELDLVRLTDRSLTQGRRLRARRRALAAGSSVGVAAVLVGVVWVGGHAGPDGLGGPAPVAAASTGIRSGGPSHGAPGHGLVVPGGPRVPATGRATAAALIDLVRQLERGTARDVAGQGGDPSRSGEGAAVETYATIQWAPAAGGAATQVQVNVQSDFSEPGFFTCADPDRAACSVARGHGLVVVSYETRRGHAVDRSVDVYHPGTGLRVVIASTNADRIEKGHAVRRRPPLTTAQLRAVATLGFWGATVPRAYAEQGATLSPYHDYDDQGTATAVPASTPSGSPAVPAPTPSGSPTR